MWQMTDSKNTQGVEKVRLAPDARRTKRVSCVVESALMTVCIEKAFQERLGSSGSSILTREREVP